MKYIITEQQYKLLSEADKVTEDEIKAAIESIDKAAKSAGFRLSKKMNTKPGKRAKTHASWILPSGDDKTPCAYLVSDVKGLHVSSRAPGGHNWEHDTTKEWSKKEKWIKVFGK